MNKGFIPTAIFFLVFATILLLLPKRERVEELSPKQLLLSITDQTRFVAIDDIAKMIVDKDPSLQLIDVRTEEEYKKFSLPGAINIPLTKIFDKDENGDLKWEAYLNQDVKTNVFYSNGTIYANQVWTLCRRLGYTNNYILDGGVNKWFDTIIKIGPLRRGASVNEQNTFKFRTAVRQYFTGGEVTAPATNGIAPAPVKRKKKKSAEGGC